MKTFLIKTRNFMVTLFSHNRKRWIIAGTFAILEIFLFFYPVSWIQEDITAYLTGEGSWTADPLLFDNSYCQVISPQYRNLTEIGLVFRSDAELSNGIVSIVISDSQGNILHSSDIPYSELEYKHFFDIPLNAKLSAHKTYYLTIHCLPDENGNVASVSMCGLEHIQKENKELKLGNEPISAQLVTKYYYENAITPEKALKCLTFIVITFLIMVIDFSSMPIISHILSLSTLAITPYILGQRYELLSISGNHLVANALSLNMLLMYLFEVVVILITLSPKVTLLITEIVMLLLYSANYYVYSYRGWPLRINDFKAIGTVAKVAGNYNLAPNTHLAMCWCIAILFIIIGICTKAPSWSNKKVKKVLHLTSIVTGIIIFFLTKHLLFNTSFLTDKGFVTLNETNQLQRFEANGYLIGSILDIKDSQISAPQNYSDEVVEEILINATNSYTSQKTIENEAAANIILIMNESFSDLRTLGDINLTTENLSYFNSLTENCLRGTTYVSVLGGGTANSEFEVFTGCTMGFLPSSYYAYEQCISRPSETLITMSKDSGFTTYSMHPEDPENWNRHWVYPYLGFENSLWINDFENCNVIHSGVSDAETYKRIINLYEQKEVSEKLFIFDLTMQNHGGYEKTNITPSISTLNAKNTIESDTYLSLIKISDDAFKELITYFETVDEPTIICMFGDHQPRFANETFLTSAQALNSDQSDIEQQISQYRTPFIIWANYDIPEVDNINISTNYLGVLLAHTAGLELTPYYQFLYNQMEKYPIVSIHGFYDSEMKYHSWNEDSSCFNDYRILQYNYLFD